MDFFASQKTHLIKTKFKSVKSNLKAWLATQKKEATYDVKDYDYPPELEEWFLNEKHKKTLVISGKRGTGKTEGIISYCKSKGLNPLYVTELQQLVNLKDTNDIIILDDLNSFKIGRQTKLSLIDVECQKMIRILHEITIIKKGIPRIVLLSRLERFIDSFDDTNALERKIKYINLEKPLFVINNSTN